MGHASRLSIRTDLGYWYPIPARSVRLVEAESDFFYYQTQTAFTGDWHLSGAMVRGMPVDPDRVWRGAPFTVADRKAEAAPWDGRLLKAFFAIGRARSAERQLASITKFMQRHGDLSAAQRRNDIMRGYAEAGEHDSESLAHTFDEWSMIPRIVDHELQLVDSVSLIARFSVYLRSIVELGLAVRKGRTQGDDIPTLIERLNAFHEETARWNPHAALVPLHPSFVLSWEERRTALRTGEDKHYRRHPWELGQEDVVARPLSTTWRANQRHEWSSDALHHCLKAIEYWLTVMGDTRIRVSFDRRDLDAPPSIGWGGGTWEALGTEALASIAHIDSLSIGNCEICGASLAPNHGGGRPRVICGKASCKKEHHRVQTAERRARARRHR